MITRRSSGLGFTVMSLDQRVRARCVNHTRALEKLAAASSEINGVDQKLELLREHLRRMYSCRPSAFDPPLVELIKKCDAPGAKSLFLKSRISTDDKSFVCGHFYLAREGVFQVIALDPYPKIAPNLYPSCNTPYFQQWMWGEHRRLLQEYRDRQRAIDAFAESYLPPLLSAADEIAEVKLQYETEIREAHRQFIESLGIPYGGTAAVNQNRRITHCYSCKSHLDNAIDTACNTCQWIVCSCGACGCGYSGQA
jgi:hypothetical protein